MTGLLQDDRFKEQDEFRFFSSRLVLARSADGTPFFLQEVYLKRPLPPGGAEVLLRLRKEYLPPVVDIREKPDRIVLVHPPLSGEPLMLLIPPKKGMDPRSALALYCRLLQAVLQLSKLPLPLITSLDPRNIILDGERFYFIFFGFRNFVKIVEDEQWRYLLYFLLTGSRMEERGSRRLDPGSPPLSGSLVELMERGLEPGMTMERMLDLAQGLLGSEKIHLADPPRSTKWRQWKRELSVLTGGAIIVFGFLGGQQFFQGMPAFDLNAPGQLAASPKGSLSEEKIVFGRDGTVQRYPLSTSAEGVRISGEWQVEEGVPFAVMVHSRDGEESIGIRSDKTGLLRPVRLQGVTEWSGFHGDPFRIQPDTVYSIDLQYIKGKPLQVWVTEAGTGKQWSAVCSVSSLLPDWVEFQGSEGVRVQKLRLLNPAGSGRKG